MKKSFTLLYDMVQNPEHRHQICQLFGMLKPGHQQYVVSQVLHRVMMGWNPMPLTLGQQLVYDRAVEIVSLEHPLPALQ